MKILLGVHQFFPHKQSGTEVLTLELARGLRAKGHHVEVISGAAEANFPEATPSWLTQDQYDDFAVHRLHYGTSERKTPIALHWGALERIRRLLPLVERLKPDITHWNHVIGFSAQVIPAMRDAGFPVLFTATDYWPICPQTTLFRTFEKSVCEGPGDGVNCLRCFRPMSAWAARATSFAARSPLRSASSRLQSAYDLQQRPNLMVDRLNAANRIFVSTHFLKNSLVAHGISPDLLRVVPYGVDIGERPPKHPVPLQFTPDCPLRLGFVGTLSEMKGPHVLLQSLTKLGTDLGRVSVFIYGHLNRTDSYCQSLERMTIGVPVQFPGTFHHGNIGRVLRSLHALVIPSLWYESSPLVLCSARSAGVPVIVSGLGGLTEDLAQGLHGFSFRAGDSQALADVIKRILMQPESLLRPDGDSDVRPRSSADYAADIEAEYQRHWTANDPR